MKIKDWKLKKIRKGIILLVLVFFVFLVGCQKKEEDYRQIQVYKIDGIVMIDRQGSSMEAYNKMQLQSGDTIETAENSSLQLKLDEDKYILVEPNSKISLQATGNSVDSKTTIYLEKGAIVNQLDNTLSKDSSYQVTTPNSTMAVRGTTFRVEITMDETGKTYAKVSVCDGQVECNLILPDGTITEPLLVKKGTEVLIWGDDTDTEYVGTRDITYEKMKSVTLDFLSVIIERGEELSITKEELEVIKEAVEMLDNTTEENSEEKLGQKEQEQETEIPKDNREEMIEEKEKKRPPKTNQDELGQDIDNIEPKESEETEIVDDKKEDENIPADLTDSVVIPGEDSTKPNEGNTSSGGSNNGGNTPSGGSNNGGNTSSGGSNNGGNASGNGSTSTQKEITINFCIDNDEKTIFATTTQFSSVEIDDLTIADPLLQPTANGRWKYDSKEVNEITTNNEDGTEINKVTITILWKDIPN